MQVHILGNGPISQKVAEELRATHKVSVYSEYAQSYRPSTGVYPYSSLKLNVGMEDNFYIIAWKALPGLGEERRVLLDEFINWVSGGDYIINLSSVAVYGESFSQNFEYSMAAPINTYGESKLNFENYLEKSSAPVCHLRLSNVYGHPDFKDLMNSILYSTITGRELSIFQPSVIVRDLVSIDFVTELISRLLDASEGLQRSSIFNLSSGTSQSLDSIISLVEEISKIKLRYSIKDIPDDVIKNSFVNSSKIKEFLHLPKVDHREKLILYINNFFQLR